MDYRILHHVNAADFISVRLSVGWGRISETLAMQIIQSSHYIVAVYDGNKMIASARTYTQGEFIIFIADVMVMPRYQRTGIGKMMIEDILEHYIEEKGNRNFLTIKLKSAAGKESFYEKLGFEREAEGTQYFIRIL